jgi:hypothetical protein
MLIFLLIRKALNIYREKKYREYEKAMLAEIVISSTVFFLLLPLKKEKTTTIFLTKQDIPRKNFKNYPKPMTSRSSRTFPLSGPPSPITLSLSYWTHLHQISLTEQLMLWQI